MKNDDETQVIDLENELFVDGSVQKKKKKKRVLTPEQRERLLANLKRGRETASRNRRIRAEAKAKQGRNRVTEPTSLAKPDNVYTRLSRMESLLESLYERSQSPHKSSQSALQSSHETSDEFSPVSHQSAPQSSQSAPLTKEFSPADHQSASQKSHTHSQPPLRKLTNFSLPEW
jgi:hypothetical protein